MRVARLCLCCILLAAPTIAQDRETLEDRVRTLRNILYENMLPFWLPQSIDRRRKFARG